MDPRPASTQRRTALAGLLREWLPTPRRNPVALGYLALLLATTVFSLVGEPGQVHRLRALCSTDVHNLTQHPLVALLFSAAWAAGSLWSPYLWAVLVTLAPLERRVGGLRAGGVFAAGHVIATLLSQLVVVVVVAAGGAASDLLDEMDIGVSYGVLATLGAFAGLLRPRGRLVALAAAGVLIGHQFLTDDDLVTGVGHPVALLVGLACWRRLRRGPGAAVPVERGVAPHAVPAEA